MRSEDLTMITPINQTYGPWTVIDRRHDMDIRHEDGRDIYFPPDARRRFFQQREDFDGTFEQYLDFYMGNIPPIMPDTPTMSGETSLMLVRGPLTGSVLNELRDLIAPWIQGNFPPGEEPQVKIYIKSNRNPSLGIITKSALEPGAYTGFYLEAEGDTFKDAFQQLWNKVKTLRPDQESPIVEVVKSIGEVTSMKQAG